MTNEEIVSVLAELYKITGFRISLHDTNYREIAAYPKEKRRFCRIVHSSPEEYERCQSCDKNACKKALALHGTHIYTCRYGLTEAVSPLYNFGIHAGFLMMGQIFKDGGERTAARRLSSSLANQARELNEAAREIPLVKADMIRSYVKIMTICAQYLTLSNAIPSSKPTVAQMAKRYICSNYQNKFSIKDICSDIGCSKSTLITAFKKEYDITVNDYITEVRLGEAVKMLAGAEMSIGEIAIRAGFSDQSYFSKVFSSKYGIAPSEYKAQIRNAATLKTEEKREI